MPDLGRSEDSLAACRSRTAARRSTTTTCAAVDEVLRGDWLTQGPAVRAFEDAVAARCEAPYAVAFSSGTAALHGAAFAAGLGPGDELVTSAITFAASANCGAYLGATPRFADIEPATWNVSPETIGAALTDRTRAVVPVHFTGLPAPIAAIRERVGEDVVIIEDAAHAIGARAARRARRLVPALGHGRVLVSPGQDRDERRGRNRHHAERRAPPAPARVPHARDGPRSALG